MAAEFLAATRVFRPGRRVVAAERMCYRPGVPTEASVNVRRMLAVSASLGLLAASGCQDSRSPVSPGPAVTTSSSATGGSLGIAIDRAGNVSTAVSLRGVVTAVDSRRMVFALDTGRETLRVRAIEKTEITAYGSRQRLRFARLAPGMTVGVRAVHDAGSLLARTIVVMP